MFRLPSRDDLVEHRVVITTLSTSKVLLDLQVFHGFFTHILIDEAAQALEPEALTPLIFAGPNTKVVFTGDHMQVLNFMCEIKIVNTKVVSAPKYLAPSDTAISHCLLIGDHVAITLPLVSELHANGILVTFTRMISIITSGGKDGHVSNKDI